LRDFASKNCPTVENNPENSGSAYDIDTFSDRTTPILILEPVLRSRQMLRLVKLVEKYLASDWKSKVNQPPGKH
jgi:hypothetical protein